MEIDVDLNLDELPPADLDRILGGLIARYDDEFGHDVEAMLRGWAEQTAQFERDGSINGRGSRPATDYRRLADAIAEHREHLATIRG